MGAHLGSSHAQIESAINLSVKCTQAGTSVVRAPPTTAVGGKAGHTTGLLSGEGGESGQRGKEEGSEGVEGRYRRGRGEAGVGMVEGKGEKWGSKV